MALITKQIKVSNKVEQSLENKLGVDDVLFKRVKFVTPFIFRFTFFVLNGGRMVGSLNYFWDTRKPQQLIYLRRFVDKKIIKVRHLNEPRVRNFYKEA